MSAAIECSFVCCCLAPKLNRLVSNNPIELELLSRSRTPETEGGKQALSLREHRTIDRLVDQSRNSAL